MKDSIIWIFQEKSINAVLPDRPIYVRKQSNSFTKNGNSCLVRGPTQFTQFLAIFALPLPHLILLNIEGSGEYLLENIMALYASDQCTFYELKVIIQVILS